MSGHAERLIVFTRYPEPGATKTRLMAALGPEGAAELQRRMTEHTLSHARELAHRCGTPVEVRYEGGDGARMVAWLGADLTCRPQGDGDLGARMERGLRDAFAEGARRVVIVGTDCPGLTAELMAVALDALKQNDLVLGPANDGGYYLIGLARAAPELFDNMPWGTDQALARSIAAAKTIGLSATLLEPLDDVDRPEDLLVWERERRATQGV